MISMFEKFSGVGKGTYKIKCAKCGKHKLRSEFSSYILKNLERYIKCEACKNGKD